jgi:hypothetical protein
MATQIAANIWSLVQVASNAYISDNAETFRSLEPGTVGATGPQGTKGDQGPAGNNGTNGIDLTVEQVIDNGDYTFTFDFSDNTSFTTPVLRGEQGITGSTGLQGLQGVSVHHTKGTSTTDQEGDFGTAGETDTYTLYGDAAETVNLGSFVVKNGLSGNMAVTTYDIDQSGVVDNSEALNGKTLATIEAERDAAIRVIKTTYSVADHTEKDVLTNLTIADKVFVADDGDGKWAHYIVTIVTDGLGSTSTYQVIMDEDTYLNANTVASVKTAYESNADTNAYTDAEKTKLSNTATTDAVTTLNAISVWGDIAGDTLQDTNVVIDGSSNITGVEKLSSTSQDIILPNADNMFIDGATDPRTITEGAFRMNHKPAVPNTRAIHIDIDANGQENTRALAVDFNANGMVTGEKGLIFEVNADTSSATGGHIEAYKATRIGNSAIIMDALHAGTGVRPIHHKSGLDTTIEQAFTYDTSLTTYADITTAVGTDTTNVVIFEEDNDVLYIGHSAAFNTINFELATPANQTIAPIFEFSDGFGVWVTFTPSDSTNGMTASGQIAWTIADLASWAIDTVNAVGSKYWIRITRTRNNLSTVPIESSMCIVIATEYNWNSDGTLDIKDITPTTTLDTVATTLTTAINEVHSESDTHRASTGTDHGYIDQAVTIASNPTFNSIVVTTTVDGRDISVDGTKLDGIETAATADQIASEVPVTPQGNLSSATVQLALEELQTDIDTINQVNEW